MKDKTEEIIKKLEEYFQNRTEVLMAFLFGSRAKGYARSGSDWDIAVYLTHEDREREQVIKRDIEGIVESEADVVILNRAPASITWPAIRTGVPLAIKDRRTFLRFMLLVSREANDWYRTSREYYRIFERSASLSEEDREHLQRAVEFLEEELKDFGKFKTLTWQEYQNDRSKKRDLERWAEQLINSMIDISQLILASERKVIPETYKMMVLNLGVITPFNRGDLCEKLSRWTELRNVLAHEYLDYRWKEISAFIQETEGLWGLFLGNVKEFLEEDK